MQMNVLDRLKAATGPDRELDAAIELAYGYSIPSDAIFRPETDYVQCQWNWVHPLDGKIFHICPLYTASIDAALALVERMLPEWRFVIRATLCELKHPQRMLKDVDGRGATPALAILIALFTALHGKDKQDA